MIASTSNPAAASLAASLGLAIPVICLPQPALDLYRWAVVACDQFTSQPDYWLETANIVGSQPSTLNLILPEIYLEHPGSLSVEARVGRINATMQQYLADGTLRQLAPGWMAIDRSTPDHPSRKGLVLAVDLECYDFTPGNRQLIRATEGTVLDRIPPRLAIRRDAPLELPHIQLLIDDPRRTVIEPLLACLAKFEPLYDTDLMQGGGHVRGWFAAADSPEIEQALTALSKLDSLQEHLLFAVGDGNHSLATAKAHWESLRGQVAADHPARYALVEVINIHDEGLAFEPIHRVIFDCTLDAFLVAAAACFVGQGLSVIKDVDPGFGAPPANGEQVIPLLWRSSSWQIRIATPRHKLPAGSLQTLLDSMTAHGDCRVDYIHGEDVVRQLAAAGNLGLLLPVLDKSKFFTIIARDGILPRKTFSMGEAFEKRYYIESRPIR